MRRIHPMTDEERTIAEKRHSLAFEFLRQQNHSRLMRSGITLSLDMKVESSKDSTFANIIPDPRQNTAIQVESNILSQQALRLSAAKETAILSFIIHGYTIPEAAKRSNIKYDAAYVRLRKFRRRARAAVAG